MPKRSGHKSGHGRGGKRNGHAKGPSRGSSRRGRGGGSAGRGRGRGHGRDRENIILGDDIYLESDSDVVKPRDMRSIRKPTKRGFTFNSRTPLRELPVVFVKATDEFDFDLQRKMIKDINEPEEEEAVLLALNSDSEETMTLAHEANVTQDHLEDIDHDDEDFLDEAYDPESFNDDQSPSSHHVYEPYANSDSEDDNVHAQFDDFERELIAENSDSDHDESLFDSDDNSAADAEDEHEEAEGEDSDNVFTDAHHELSDMGSDASDLGIDEADMEDLLALQTMALRDIEGYGDDFEQDDEDFYGDSSADELIQQLIQGGLDLSQLEGRTQTSKRQPKAPLSRRRRERLEARDAMRATNFGKDPELWQKYPAQMTVHQVLQEIQELVTIPNRQQIKFPPFDNNANWYVSELAKLHGLKPKVIGRNMQKYVIVSRTSRTGPTRNWGKLESLVSRRQNFRRTDKDGAPAAAVVAANTTRKRTKLREGDIVGNNATQISSENFGHKLMLKMGWEQGTGLGADRKGILDPISATIKLTKTGIGRTTK